MNIAEQIKRYHAENDIVESYDDLVDECEEKAIDVEVDWDNGATTFEFADGSVLVLWGSRLDTYMQAYGCRN